MYRSFFKEPVIFHRLGGGVEDFWENKKTCHQKSIKGDYRILTADEEGGGDHENIREPYGRIR